jgi:hypothetical protein
MAGFEVITEVLRPSFAVASDLLCDADRHRIQGKPYSRALGPRHIHE